MLKEENNTTREWEGMGVILLGLGRVFLWDWDGTGFLLFYFF